MTWSCGPPIDASGIDSAKACAGNLCIVGGGEISPAVAGWTHVSHDGGQTWEAARSLNAPFPIRSVLAVPTAKVRWRPALHCGCLPIPPRPILAPPGPNPPHCGWRQLLFKRRRHVQLCRWWCELDARCKHRWRGGEGLSSPAAACSARDSRVVRQCRPGQWGRLFSRRVGSGTAVIAPVQRKVLGRSPEGTLQAAWGWKAGKAHPITLLGWAELVPMLPVVCLRATPPFARCGERALPPHCYQVSLPWPAKHFSPPRPSPVRRRSRVLAFQASSRHRLPSRHVSSSNDGHLPRNEPRILVGRLGRLSNESPLRLYRDGLHRRVHTNRGACITSRLRCGAHVDRVSLARRQTQRASAFGVASGDPMTAGFLIDFGDGNSASGGLVRGAVDPLLGLLVRSGRVAHAYPAAAPGFPYFNATLRLCCRPVDVVNNGGADMILQVFVIAGPG